MRNAAAVGVDIEGARHASSAYDNGLAETAPFRPAPALADLLVVRAIEIDQLKFRIQMAAVRLLGGGLDAERNGYNFMPSSTLNVRRKESIIDEAQSRVIGSKWFVWTRGEYCQQLADMPSSQMSTAGVWAHERTAASREPMVATNRV